jgi:hypothetical protein
MLERLAAFQCAHGVGLLDGDSELLVHKIILLIAEY